MAAQGNINWSQCPLDESEQGVQSGAPVLSGTRMTLRRKTIDDASGKYCAGKQVSLSHFRDLRNFYVTTLQAISGQRSARKETRLKLKADR